MDGGDEYVPDKDWISRRWQGEGKVVRRDPKPTGPPPLKAARTAGDQEFESGLGAHCASCGALDFLPVACTYCRRDFCRDCIDVDAHSCTAKYDHQPRRVQDDSGFASEGDNVVLHSLKASAAHNGKRAVVQGPSLQRASSGHDRFVIRTSSGTELAVKAANMRHVAPEPEPEPKRQREPEPEPQQAAKMMEGVPPASPRPQVALLRTKSAEERERTTAAVEALAAERAEAEAVEAELAATEAVVACKRIDQAIDQMVEQNTLAVVEGAARLLVKVFGNILAQPDNPKFQRLRKDNKQLASKVLSARGALSLLLAAGFQPDSTHLVLPPGFDVSGIEHASLCVGGIAQAKQTQLARKNAAEREAALAAARRDAAARKAKVTQLKAAAEGDKVARRDPGWKAKAFEKGGADPARVPGGGRG